MPRDVTGPDAVDAVPDLAAIRRAHARIADAIRRTPVHTSRSIDLRAGARIHFKCENFQRVGAFKARGAANAVRSLTDAEASRGVVTHSSGNHGAAVAWAAQARGVPAWIVMPDNAPAIKRRNVEGFGGSIVSCAPSLAAREAACRELGERHGASLVHPYNDFRVIAGQGTAALELLDEIPDLDVVIAPIGGGGLISGTAIAAKGMRPAVRVLAAEPRAADDAQRSFRSGRIEPASATVTVADGLRATLGDKTFPLVTRYVDDVVTCSEASIIEAMRFVWERMKIVIEPSCAVALAAVFEGTAEVRGQKVGIVFTGGNVDLDRLPWQTS